MMRHLTIVIAALAWSAQSVGAELVTPAPVELIQQKELKRAQAEWSRLCGATVGAPVSAQAPASARRSAGTPPVITLRNVDFRIVGNIGFDVSSLVAQLVPVKAGEPVDLDNPAQFDIHILGGEVTVPKRALDALFNDYLLDYSPRSLNAIGMQPANDRLDVTGGLKLKNHFPGFWLGFSLSGNLALKDNRYLIYTPDDVTVTDIPMKSLLSKLGIELSDMVPFDRPGVKLEGNQMTLDQQTLFPGPKLIGKLLTAKVTERGLVLGFAPAKPFCAPPPVAVPPSSYMWIQSGDLKMFNVLMTNSRVLVTDSSTRGPLRFDLYGYRGQVAQGFAKMAPDGTLLVEMGRKTP
jgi:hypothetical protein